MSQAAPSTAEALNNAVSPDEALQSRHERVVAGRILLAVLVVALIAAVLVFQFGLIALNMIALVATVVVLGLLIAYAAGL